MRIYMNGTLSKPQQTFLPEDIFFANDKADDTDIVDYNCIQLTGLECECSHEGTEWSCRWKGVELSCEKEYEEEFDKELLLDLIKSRKLSLANMSAYFGSDVKVKVTSLMILDGDWGTETYLDAELLKNEIDFVE